MQSFSFLERCGLTIPYMNVGGGKKKTELCQLDLLARVISFIISPQVAGCTKAAHQAKQCHAACDERKTPGKNNAMQRAKEKHHASAQTKKKDSAPCGTQTKKTSRHAASERKKCHAACEEKKALSSGEPNQSDAEI
jgi:hypothetical protein